MQILYQIQGLSVLLHLEIYRKGLNFLIHAYMHIILLSP